MYCQISKYILRAADVEWQNSGSMYMYICTIKEVGTFQNPPNIVLAESGHRGVVFIKVSPLQV